MTQYNRKARQRKKKKAKQKRRLLKKGRKKMGETFLDGLNLGDTFEYSSLPDGSEEQVRLVSVEVKESKKGNKYLNAKLDMPQQPRSKDIYHMMMFPSPEDDAKKANNRKLAIARFIQAFGGDPSAPGDLNLLVGNMTWAILREEDDEEYGTKNTIRRFVEKG